VGVWAKSNQPHNDIDRVGVESQYDGRAIDGNTIDCLVLGATTECKFS